VGGDHRSLIVTQKTQEEWMRVLLSLVAMGLQEKVGIDKGKEKGSIPLVLSLIKR